MADGAAVALVRIGDGGADVPLLGVRDRKEAGMRYFLKSNLTILLRNWATYLPTALFLTAGMTVLFAVLCGVFSFHDDLRDRMRNVRGMDIRIEHHWQMYNQAPPRDNYMQEFGINLPLKNRYIPDENSVLILSDLTLIEERSGGRADFKASLITGIYSWSNGESYSCQTTFLSNDYFAPFRDQMQGDFIVGSRRLLEYAAVSSTPGSSYRRLPRFPFIYDPVRGFFTDLDGNGEIRTLAFEDAERLDEFDLLPFIHEAATEEAREPRWDTYLLVPMKYYFDVYWPGDNPNMTLRASAEDFNDLYEVLAILNANHKGRVTYVFEETASVFLRGVREQTEMIAVVIPATLLLMLVISMNFMGLQLMSVRRRRRDFAIQMTCGAGRRHIQGGALLLVMLTVTAAALLAIVLGSVAVRMLDVRLYNVFVTVKWVSVLPVLGFGWLIGALSCLPTLVRLSKMSPVDIFSEQ
jgi:hypothetical protein